MLSDLSLEERIARSQKQFQLLPPEVQISYRQKVAVWERKRIEWFAAVKTAHQLKMTAAKARLEAEEAERDIERLAAEEKAASEEVARDFRKWKQ